MKKSNYKRSSLLENLDSEIAIKDQLEFLLPFKSLSNEQITALAKDVKDSEAGMAMYFIGPTRMEHILPLLLTNIQDQNWPAFRWYVKLLVDIGEKLIPEIKNVFKTEFNDTVWHNNIIWVLNHWDRQLVNQLKSELIETVLKADFDNASISALELLHKKQLIDEIETLEYYYFLNEKYANNPDIIDDLNDLKEIVDTFKSK